MKIRHVLFLILSILGLAMTSMMCIRRNNPVSTEQISDHIMNTEWKALERWGNGDIGGYLDMYADGVTYFSPGTVRRLDGIDTLRTLFGPIAGTVEVDHYEFFNPKVQIIGDVAVLTFNEIAYLPTPEGNLRESHWNCTEVYTKIDKDWKIIHSHWSRPPTHPLTDRKEDI